MAYDDYSPCRVYIDIETRPPHLSPDDRAALVSAPANYKDPEKIAAYIAEHAEDAWRRCALDYRRGHILAIGVAVDDGPVEVHVDEEGDGLACLDGLYATLKQQCPNGRLLWVGHNVKGFDLPWIWRLAVRHAHPIAGIIPRARYDKRVDDTMDIWAGTDWQHKASLSDIAAYLHLEAKLGKGSDVCDLWLARDWDKLRAYCAQDVAITRAAYRAMVMA